MTEEDAPFRFEDHEMLKGDTPSAQPVDNASPLGTPHGVHQE
jgi:hypothetical protein